MNDSIIHDWHGISYQALPLSIPTPTPHPTTVLGDTKEHEVFLGLALVTPLLAQGSSSIPVNFIKGTLEISSMV